MVLPSEVSSATWFLSDHQYDSATGETIPIRLFLGGFDLTPTFREVNKKFSVRYYLNLVLIDEENRRYFKQQVSLSVFISHMGLLCLRKLLYSEYQK
jgi:hypothetical protein